MAGNLLGPKGRFGYVSDAGTGYILTTDVDLGAAGGLQVGAQGYIQPPKRFRPRGVYCEYISDTGTKFRKFVPCLIDSPLYASNIRQSVTIDGLAFQTTGRRGERLTF